MSQVVVDLAALTLEVSPYRSPFDDKDADLVLHASDGGRFAVHKIFLAIASPLLKRCLMSGSSSPCPLFNGLVIRREEDRDTIDLVEDSLTTERALQYCYPFSNPVLENLDDIQSVLEMMRKFGMKGVMDRVKGLLVQPTFLNEEPLRVFAIAYRFGFEAEARLAAQYTLRFPIFGPYVKELEHIPASVYHKLLQYHRKCSVAACALTSDFSWFPGFASRWVWFQCDDCIHHSLSWPLADGKIYEINAWFIEYMERTRGALRERPCAKVVNDPMLIVEALETAAGCHTCRPAAFLDLSTFIGEHFTVEVERAIEAVELDIPF
ncbi:hypothetical protein HYDPIDRAFT_110632 [Hydnomerulius pinastri MD-312]|nr:hypothetical protein HYDPIDRAFT_110632 [Hydnomerulius pinastri MD-312]